MAEQADFYVKNQFSESIEAYIKLPDGKTTSHKTIAPTETEMFLVSGFDVYLIVNTPAEKNTDGCYINVKPDNGLPVTYETAATHWALQIKENTLPPQAPTTVNVDAGEDE